MHLAIVGLGRMGMNMGARLVQKGHVVSGFDVSPQKQADSEANGIHWQSSVKDLVISLSAPRAIWLMVPAGSPVDDAIAQALPALSAGDVLIDGGNSFYKDSMRRADELKKKGIYYLDCGTSGGVWGLNEGYCLMIGGEKEAFDRVESIFTALAPESGCKYVGKSGAGHFVKIIHNGLEYGMLEAMGEAFEILHSSQFDLDLKEIAALWNHGSIVRSWLLELAARVFESDPQMKGIAGYVEDTGEGRWTVIQALEQNVPAPVITQSLIARIRSRQDESFSAKVIAALRNQFGGHTVKKG